MQFSMKYNRTIRFYEISNVTLEFVFVLNLDFFIVLNIHKASSSRKPKSRTYFLRSKVVKMISKQSANFNSRDFSQTVLWYFVFFSSLFDVVSTVNVISDGAYCLFTRRIRTTVGAYYCLLTVLDTYIYIHRIMRS